MELEIVISTWINEIDLSLKAYDIVSLMRNIEDFQVQTSKIHIENVNMASDDVESLRMLKNPKLRYKALSWGESRTAEKLWKVRARDYASDHRDS